MSPVNVKLGGLAMVRLPNSCKGPDINWAAIASEGNPFYDFQVPNSDFNTDFNIDIDILIRTGVTNSRV